MLLFNKNPNDKDVVAATTVVAIIIRADSVMARSGIADNKLFTAPFFHYQAPPSMTIRSVMNPAHNPTKMPIIRMLFVACLLPELYINSETHINAPPAMDKNST